MDRALLVTNFSRIILGMQYKFGEGIHHQNVKKGAIPSVERAEMRRGKVVREVTEISEGGAIPSVLTVERAGGGAAL
jgi:hypothetical protein